MNDGRAPILRSMEGAAASRFQSVERMPAYLQVAEQLRQFIVDGKVAAGEELPTERELCAELGVSRTTIREAMRALQAQGLILARPAPKRPIVTPAENLLAGAFDLTLRLGHVSLFDVVQFRGMLELEAIDRALLGSDVNIWGAVRAAWTRMSGAVDDVSSFHGAYTDFHFELVRAAGNEMLVLTMQATLATLADHLGGAFRQVHDQRDGVEVLERIVHDHAQVLDALVASDSERARDLLRDHLNHFYNELLAVQPIPAAPEDL